MKKIKFVLPILIVVLPFVYYFWFIFHYLIQVEYPDSFAYLWRQSFNFYYLTGRSLTQRVIFTISGNNAEIISIVQLIFYLFTAISLYFLLSDGKGFGYKLFSALFISFLFSSYTLNVSAVVINSEPIFVSLIILVTFWLFLYRGPYRYVTVFLVAVAFLLSKNTAPYYLILLIVMWFVTLPKYLCNKKNILFYSLLVLIALGRMHITNLYDTSIDVNVLNNAYRRIFIDPKTVAVFHDKYDMPTGIFVEQCRGEWIGVPCLGYNVLAIDQESQNYVLVEDETGFVYWIKNSGQEAYLKYLLIDEPMGTLNKYSQAFQKLSSRSNTIQFMIDYLGVEIRTNQPNNLTKIKELGKESGFFGFDVLSVLHTFLLNFGFNHAGLVGLYAFIGWVVLHRFRFIEYFPLAISMLCCSLGLFFLTFFGDGMEIRRHVFPSFVLLTLGGTLYLLSWLRISFFIAKSGLAFACTRLASLRSASG